MQAGAFSSATMHKEYYDQEWGTPVYDDATLFELWPRNTSHQLDYDPNKGEFQKAFDNFDYKK
jgi:DNA-3-methyladenine glycosylase I